jgi:branched-chain amino acid aminotransferase
MPLVNYTTQYGLGCFEGLKALPQKDGGLAIFRPDQNAARFRRSMEGLLMPGFPEKEFVSACVKLVADNSARGYRVKYNSAWEKDSFMSADSLYVRPFAYSEGAIGVAPSKNPWVVIIGSPVSAYFSGGRSNAVTTERIRATPRGTGWIKAASNYVISTLAKHEATSAGYMECIFLDACEAKYIEEALHAIFLSA